MRALGPLPWIRSLLIVTLFNRCFIGRYERQGRELALYHEMGVAAEHQGSYVAGRRLQIPSSELRTVKGQKTVT